MKGWIAAALLAPAIATADGGNARRFAPTPVLSPYLTLDGARSHGAGSMAFGLTSSLEKRPLVFYRDGHVTSEIIAERLALDTTFAYGLLDDLDVGLTVPLVAWQNGDGLPGQELAQFALGDPAVGVRYALLDARQAGIGLAAIASATAPLGDDGAFAADSGPTGRLKLALDLPLGGRFDLTGNLGYHLRAEDQIDRVVVGDELLFGLGASWRYRSNVAFLAEVTGATSAEAAFEVTEESPADINVGVRYRVFGTYELIAGVGGGAQPGYGAPAWRLFVGLESSPRRHDWDSDLVLDGRDDCLIVPGLVSNAGCPLAIAGGDDTDNDGIKNALDMCPELPEDADGFLDDDGCPDPDNDLDLLADTADGSPLSPEDWDGFEDEDGTPDLDNDNDGVADFVDACPLEKGGATGCPGDGQSLAGSAPPPVREPDAPLVLGDTVHPARPIIFEFARPELTADAQLVVAGMARYLNANPELGRVEVGVHVDSMGSRRWKHGLSRRRAKSVRQALITAGVPPTRLSAHGYGPEVPVATNTTKAGRYQNRRVELRFLKAGLERKRPRKLPGKKIKSRKHKSITPVALSEAP